MDATTYRYNDHGNLIEKTQPGKSLTFAYDLDNRLSEVKENSAALATYGYDPFGRRIWKEVHGQRAYYHYSDQGLVAELDATGTLLKSYGYKPGNPWGTDPLYVRQGGKNHWYLTDHLGTPQQVVAENGAVVWQAQYRVFGKAEVDAGSTITSNLRFPGQYYDAETGLHYNWNRYYDPEAGRYTQTDPIGLNGGVNIYEYCRLNPVNRIDFNGLKPSIIDLIGYYNTLDEAGKESCRDVIKGDKLSPCCDQIECQMCIRKLCELYGPPGTSTYGLCWLHVHKICAPCK